MGAWTWAKNSERNAAIIAARIASDEPNTAIARRFGLSKSTIGKILRDADISAPAQDRHAARDAEIVRCFKLGQTLQQVGDAFGMTRERVRQIIGKRAGLKGKDGGLMKRSADRRLIVAAKARERYIAKYGLTLEQFRLIPTRLVVAFKRQRRSAQLRGVPWQMNLREWLAAWESSGVIHLRGRGAGGYCMARIDDRGGYAVGNVKFITNSENAREYQAAKKSGTRKATKTVATGVYYALPGYGKPFQAYAHGKCIGYFETAAEAIAEREAHQ